MEISGISTVSPSAMRINLVEQATQLVADQKLTAVQEQQVAVGKASPNVTTSQTYSPALYAQAAQFQIYNQSGTLAALLGINASGTPSPSVSRPETKIEAVDSSANGSRLDTLA